MNVRFEVHYREIQRLESKMAKLPGIAEKTVNETIHGYGIRTTVEEITKLMPVSTKKGRIRSKRHAKTSRWSQSEEHNLSFTIKPRGGAANRRGSFGYLVFPEKGLGSHNPVEQRFMDLGLLNATPKILNKLNENIDRKLKEAL